MIRQVFSFGISITHNYATICAFLYSILQGLRSKGNILNFIFSLQKNISVERGMIGWKKTEIILYSSPLKT